MIYLRSLQGFGSFFAHLLVFTSRILQPVSYLKKPTCHDWQAVGGDLRRVLDQHIES